MTFKNTEMDLVRGALFNALAEGMSLIEVAAMSEHAATADDFDFAINTLAQASPSNALEPLVETGVAMFFSGKG